MNSLYPEKIDLFEKFSQDQMAHGYIVKPVVEKAFPNLYIWANFWSAQLGREVSYAVFQAVGPRMTASEFGVTVHHQPRDWILCSPAEFSDDVDETGRLSSEARHLQIYHDEILQPALNGTKPVEEGEQLIAIVLGGQPGSGKTWLEEMAMEELPVESTVIINIDDLRDKHPLYGLWQSHPSTEEQASGMTQPDASAWEERFLLEIAKNRRHIILN